jgi:DNA-binding protein YbaB
MAAAQQPSPRTGNEEIDRLLAGVSDQVGRVEEIRKDFGELRGHGEAAEGMVKVEVRPGGALSSVEINPRAMRLGSEALGEAILAAAQIAEQDVTGRMSEVMKPIVGETAAFADILRGKMPSLDSYNPVPADPRLSAMLGKLEELRRKTSGPNDAPEAG